MTPKWPLTSKNKNTLHTLGNNNLFERKVFEHCWFFLVFDLSDPLMTFDIQMVDTLRTPSGNNACVLMASLCYIICKYSDFLNNFKFWPFLTFDSLTVGRIKTSPF